VTGGRQRNYEFCAQNIFENLIMLMEIIQLEKNIKTVGYSIFMNSSTYKGPI
jgi:hypothetical protein